FVSQESDAGVQFSMPSPEQQKRLGAQATVQILSQYREIKDRRATHFAELGARLVKALPTEWRTLWNYEFHVLESKEINAFSIPGGRMFIFTGLSQVMKPDDAIASKTGHERAHVYSQHWAKAYAKTNRQGLVVDIAAILPGLFVSAEVRGSIAAD